MKPARTALVVLFLAPLLPSCVLLVAGAAGAAGAMYVNGDFDARLAATPKRCAEAARRVLEELDIKVTKCESSAIDGRVEGRSALDKEIAITLKRDSETETKITIRVGTWGDESVSRQIYDKIKARL